MVFICSFVFIPGALKDASLHHEQKKLADKLGIAMKDYPYVNSYPEGYFHEVLYPGMAIQSVHSIVIGHEQVFNCYGTDELYYYFSTNDEDALRFVLHYDQEHKFVRMQGEDDDSRTLSKRGCVSGLLEP